MNQFSRGTVVKVKFPEYSYDSTDPDDVKLIPYPHSVIRGIRKAILLSNSELHFPEEGDVQILSSKHIAVIPISSATVESRDGRILPTYLKLDCNKYEFLDRECYALANQIITIPIQWVTNRVAQGSLDELDMLKLDSLLLISSGTADTVSKMIKDAVQQEVENILEQLDQDA